MEAAIAADTHRLGSRPTSTAPEQSGIAGLRNERPITIGCRSIVGVPVSMRNRLEAEPEMARIPAARHLLHNGCPWMH